MYKNISILIIVVILCLFLGHKLFALDNSHDDRDMILYNKTLLHAQKTGQHVLIVFDAAWCVWCKKLQHEILDTQQFRKKISKKCVIIYIDIDKNPYLYKQYIEALHTNKIINKQQVQLPFYVLLSKDIKHVIKHGQGYRTKTKMIQWLGFNG